MLSKVFEWSRVANLAPDDDFVTKRKLVVQGLADELPKKLPLLVDCACAAAAGVIPRFPQEADVISIVVAAIRDQQPAFPGSLKENHVDVRTTCALVVGEVADRAAKGKGAPSAASRLMTAIVLAGLSNKPLASERHLRAMLLELSDVCGRVAVRAADYRRRRYALVQSVESITEAADVPTFWKDAKPKLVQLAQFIGFNQEIDREEIDTLWWAFNGVLSETGEAFAEMTAATAALRGAIDLADTVLLPPLPNTKFLLRRMVSSGRKASEIGKRPIRDWIGEWNDAAVSSLASASPKAIDFVRLNPGIFPLTWMCLRKKESGVAIPADFKRSTGWDLTTEMTAASLAYQVFDECIAKRQYEASFAG